MRVNFPREEKRDKKAGGFWSNLVGKLGLEIPISQRASAPKKEELLSDGIQTHSGQEPNRKLVAGSGIIQKISEQSVISDDLLNRFAVIHRESNGELTENERVKAADRLTRISDGMGVVVHEMEEFRSGPTSAGGESNDLDLSSQIAAKSDAISGLCLKLKDKVADLNLAQARAIEEVFLSMSQAQTDAEALESPTELGLEMTGPELLLITDQPDAPDLGAPTSPVAGHVSDWIRKASGDLYEKLRTIHMKMSLAEAMLDGISTDLEVGGIMGQPLPPEQPGELSMMDAETTGDMEGPSPMAPEEQLSISVGELRGTMDRIAVAPPGMEHVVKKLKDEPEVENPYAVAWAMKNKSAAADVCQCGDLKTDHNASESDEPGQTHYGSCKKCGCQGYVKTGTTDDYSKGASGKNVNKRTAASGDPGDTEEGNLVYKDINKCRDCVWFESDWTHETYRDKCKDCIFAKMDGTINHFWPKSQQMIVYTPGWGAPEAGEKKANIFNESLSLHHKALTDAPPAQVKQIAEVIMKVGKTASEIGSEFMSMFNDPFYGGLLRTMGNAVADEIASQTGIEFIITSDRAKEWGRKSVHKPGETAIAYTPLGQEAKGEREKIKNLRQKLEKTDDPVEIKSINDAINSMDDRRERDKAAKERRKEMREEKKKEDDQTQEKLPEQEGGFRGTLCLGNAPSRVENRFAGSLSLDEAGRSL